MNQTLTTFLNTGKLPPVEIVISNTQILKLCGAILVTGLILILATKKL